jgi:hypothetical protein
MASAGMALAGGGNSHNDAFALLGGAVLGALGGAIVAPILTVRFLGLRESRRLARVNGDPVIPLPNNLLWQLAASLVAAFLFWTLLYYATSIAELPPEMGGPRSSIPGVLRARVSLGAGLVAGVASLVLFVRVVRRRWD